MARHYAIMTTSTPAFCRPAAFRAFAQHLPTADTPTGLFSAAWAIAQHERPEAELKAGLVVIENLAAAIHRRVKSRTPVALLTHLHDLMFDVLGFHGNTEDYYQPANSYLPDVLRTRRGLPISLTLVYRTVAAELGLTVYGINAPGHFLAEIVLDPSVDARPTYVDPFFGGGLLTRDEVLARIAKTTGQEIEPSPELLSRATPRRWLARMLHNLQAVFASSGRERDVYAIQELEALLSL
jgi:regulator of sirC expression with transglutaminase-like and TPR domain